MQDQPSAIAILDLAIGHLRENVLPGLDARAKFEMRVTLNALQMVRRTMELTPASDARELSRLGTLLGEEGDLAMLNRLLCERIRSGEIDLKTPGLFDHLFATTLDKLAVDQPSYAAYRRAIEG